MKPIVLTERYFSLSALELSTEIACRRVHARACEDVAQLGPGNLGR